MSGGPGATGAIAGPAAVRGRLAAWRSRDLTRGSLWTSLIVLSLPLLATSFSAVAYQLVDLSLIAGLGEDALTAVVISNQSFRQLVMILVMGAGFGAQGVLSRLVGAGDHEAAAHAAGQLISGGALFSLAVAIGGLAFAPQLLSLMNVSPEVHALGVPYLRLAFALNFGMTFVVLFGAILNGAGDSTTPMAIAIVQSSLALLAEWVLIRGHVGLPPLGIAGVAIGQAIGQGVGVALALGVLLRGTSRVHVRPRHLVPDLRLLGRILRLSWPSALQMLGSFLVNVWFLRLAGDFGPKAQAAFSVGLRLAMVGPMVAFPLAGACATLVGQNLGAGSVPRAWRALWTGLTAHAVILIGIGIGLVALRYEVLALFADDPEVIALGAKLLVFQGASFCAWAFYFPFFRALQGAGDVFAPMLISLGNSVLVTLPAGWWLATRSELGVVGLFAASFVGAVTATAATSAWVVTGRWTRRRGPRRT